MHQRSLGAGRVNVLERRPLSIAIKREPSIFGSDGDDFVIRHNLPASLTLSYAINIHLEVFVAGPVFQLDDHFAVAVNAGVGEAGGLVVRWKMQRFSWQTTSLTPDG